MTNLAKRLWSDDDGAIISVEMILIIGVLLFGIIPGLVAMRNSINAAFGTIGNTLTRLVPSFTYSGWAFLGAGTSGNTIAVVQGLQVDGNPAAVLTAQQVTPIVAVDVVIPPAP